MFNRVILVGNLTKDPDLKYSQQGGTAICNTGIATNRRYKKQDGSSGEEVCFIDVTFFGRTAEIANQYLKKGSKVLVEGRLKFDSWDDQGGQKRNKHTIVVESMQMLDSKGVQNVSNESGYDSSSSKQDYNVSEQQTKPAQAHQNIPEVDVNKDVNEDIDEIPF